jgi:xylulokinase
VLVATLRAAAGIDLSTTAAKAGLVAEDGRVLAIVSVPYPSRYADGGVVEQEAGAWWDSVSSALRAAIHRAPDAEIVGVSISSQGITFVPVDERGFPLRPALTWLDMRASAEADILAQTETVAGVFALAGRRPSAAYTLPKLMWMRAHEPHVFARASAFLLPLDFLVSRLTGGRVTDHTMAAATLCYGLREASWSTRLLDHAGVDPSRLASIRWAGTVAGLISRDSAAECGLPKGTPVIVGGQDQKCAALAAGLSFEDVTVSLGTAAAVIGMTPTLVLDPEMRVPAFPSFSPGAWLLEGVVGTAGASLAWLGRMLVAPDSSPWTFEALIAAAAGSPPGARGVRFLAHLAGATAPSWRDGASGAFTGLSLSTTVQDLSRAVLEGVAVQIAANVDAMRSCGISARALRIFGGGAQSALWRRVIAATTDMPVIYSGVHETALVGAAILAGVGVGLWSSRDAAVDLVHRHLPSMTTDPDPGERRVYENVLREYEALDECLARL